MYACGNIYYIYVYIYVTASMWLEHLYPIISTEIVLGVLFGDLGKITLLSWVSASFSPGQTD